MKIKLLSIPFALLMTFGAKSASAISYEGTCNTSDKCEIKVLGDSIKTSNGLTIKTDNIIGWTLTNGTNRGGVFFVATNEDYRVLIKYFNKTGSREIAQIGFFNFKTAQNFISSLELVSGLAPNHDQAGATTFCTASGKDYLSGTQFDGRQNKPELLSDLNNTVLGGVLGGVVGSVTGDTGTALGAYSGAMTGLAVGRPSGSFNLKRGIVSEVRDSPAQSGSFYDGSFNGRSDCIDEPTISTTNVNFNSPIPIRMEKREINRNIVPSMSSKERSLPQNFDSQ